MARMSKIILPYEAGYVGNKEADKRKEAGEQSRQRKREFAERQQPPFIVPERRPRSELLWRHFGAERAEARRSGGMNSLLGATLAS